MNLLVCIDDTDNLESPGTGHLASQLVEIIEAEGWGSCSYITRHQLLVHPDVPYTSHNSAMCFGVVLSEPDALDRMIAAGGRFLEREAADGSDPGLCVVRLEDLAERAALLEFGRAAKERVVAKDEAYSLARQLGVHLSEHGGTGQGVVGALAGVGLRLGGNDGRLKGQLRIGALGEARCVADLLAHPLVDKVRGLDGSQLQAGEMVELGEKIKTVMLGGSSVLLVERTTDAAHDWRTCSRQQLRNY